MLQIYNTDTLSEIYRRIPEDRFSGDGNTKDFALYHLTSALLQRVFANEVLLGSNVDYYAYIISGTSFVSFYNAPSVGSNNIICQGNECLFFPSGTTNTGYLNGYNGDSIDLPYYILNDDAGKSYADVTITPQDEVIGEGDDEKSFIKIATTQEGLNSAVAGASLNYGTIADNNIFHTFWVRLTIPHHFLAADIQAFNKYDLALILSSVEY